VTNQVLARARAGDEDALRELTDPYRRELGSTSTGSSGRSNTAAERERAPPPESKRERDAVGCFADAIQTGDIDGVVALLTDEAWLTMPPEAYEYRPSRASLLRCTIDPQAGRSRKRCR
jgi:hypothetical protein